jgi:hypothetical protein
MNDGLEIDAHDYLLDQMDPARRSVFEERLRREPEARAALKTVGDGLANFAVTVAPPDAMHAKDQRAALATILAATSGATAAVPRRRATGWMHLIWPAAAAVLLVLNFVSFERPFGGERRPPGMPPPRTVQTPAGPATELPSPTADAATTFAVGAAATSAPPAPRAERSLTTADPSEVERLRAHVAELQRAQQALRADYNSVVERLANLGLVERELNRLTTMELVDANSYARGERKGLVNVGRSILTEPGVVISETAPPPPTTSQVAPAQPYAWSVFDEKENRGYLNLYQLPVVTAEQTMQVWVRPADGKEFQAVGEVPRQFHGGNGSVQYLLPNATATPSEIVITIEPRGPPPPAPAGPTVLRGP